MPPLCKDPTSVDNNNSHNNNNGINHQTNNNFSNRVGGGGSDSEGYNKPTNSNNSNNNRRNSFSSQGLTATSVSTTTTSQTESSLGWHQSFNIMNYGSSASDDTDFDDDDAVPAFPSLEEDEESNNINNPLLLTDNSSLASSSPSTSSSSLNNVPHGDCNRNGNGNAVTNGSRKRVLKRRHSSDTLWISKFPFISRYIQRNWTETTVSGWHMMRFWVFGMITPLSVLTWTATHQVSAVVASIFVLPTVAIIQGSYAIWRYRVKFGDSPLPLAPSHGIVKCRKGFVSTTTTTTTTTKKNHNGSFSMNGSRGGSGPTEDSINYGSSTYLNRSMLDVPIDDVDTLGASLGDMSHHSLNGGPNTTPLRLLVIGDSLAIGVGQSRCSTPIMPETIAKSLSKAMNGRPVLWTCHGAPGASAGWIVRELERSINNGQFMQANPPGRTTSSSSNATTSITCNDSTTLLCHNHMDVDSCSSSDESSDGTGDAQPTTSTTTTTNTPHGLTMAQDENDEELKTWSDRLKEHRIGFDPSVLGPFDIAVVLTGSNDLKSAFFPFLLTGEDAEFRRQAQLRGGGYGKELSRILQVLNRRMRMRLQTLREQVEAASERVRESVDNIRERLGSHDFSHGDMNHTNSYGHSNVNSSSNRRAAATLRRTTYRSNGSTSDMDGPPTQKHQSATRETSSLLHHSEHGDSMMLDSTNHLLNSHGVQSSLFPMVVLPGMPSRALPIFQTVPLRWLAVPIVDIMDSHKKNLSQQHDGEVFFVDAPSVADMAAYSDKTGIYYQEELEDRIMLQLRDIKRKHSRRIESDMAQYFSKYNNNDHAAGPESFPLRKRHFSMVSPDGIHPNDEGYDFWGRYIAHSIVEEWKRKQKENGILEVV